MSPSGRKLRKRSFALLMLPMESCNSPTTCTLKEELALIHQRLNLAIGSNCWQFARALKKDERSLASVAKSQGRMMILISMVPAMDTKTLAACFFCSNKTPGQMNQSQPLFESGDQLNQQNQCQEHQPRGQKETAPLISLWTS